MLIGERIRAAIDQAGWDPIKVAAAINMSTANLYRIFKRDSVETKYLHRIGALLNIPLSYFFEDNYNTEPLMQTGSADFNLALLGEATMRKQLAEKQAEIDKYKLTHEHLEQRLKDKEDIITLLRVQLASES